MNGWDEWMRWMNELNGWDYRHLPIYIVGNTYWGRAIIYCAQHRLQGCNRDEWDEWIEMNGWTRWMDERDEMSSGDSKHCGCQYLLLHHSNWIRRFKRRIVSIVFKPPHNLITFLQSFCFCFCFEPKEKKYNKIYLFDWRNCFSWLRSINISSC